MGASLPAPGMFMGVQGLTFSRPRGDEEFKVQKGCNNFCHVWSACVTARSLRPTILTQTTKNSNDQLKNGRIP
jgi:hypothetical protein